MKKVKLPEAASNLEQIVNVGPSLARDLRSIGVSKPSDLKKKDPYQLYIKLCQKTRSYHDPCVLDVFISAINFMDGKGARVWWSYTNERKKNFSKVENKIKKWRDRK